MMAALLWSALALVLLAIILVLLPLRIRVAAESAPRPALRVELRPIAGLAPWIRVFDSARPGKVDEKRRKARPKRDTVTRKDGAKKRRVARVDIRRLLPAAPDLLRGLLRVFRFDRLDVEGTFGLGDPADTGAAYGAVAPPLVAAGYALGRPHAVRIVPDFDRMTLEGRAEAELTVMPFRAFPPAIRFAWAVFGPAR